MHSAREKTKATVVPLNLALRPFLQTIDWGATALGPPAQWPPTLLALLGPLLSSRLPFLILWGPNLLMLYNEAYTELIGGKHPAALGRPAREVFPEIWDVIGPMFEQVIRTGEATSSRDQLLRLDRRGFIEECYFTFSYSPIRDENDVVGVLTSGVIETTDYVINRRRLELLRRLGERLATLPEQADAAEIGAAACEITVSDLLDAPFCLLYLLEHGHRRAVRSAACGVDHDSPLAPSTIELSNDDEAPWPLARALTQRTPLIASAPDMAPALSPWCAPVRSACLLPLDDGAGPAAVLIVGLSPHIPLDDGYRALLDSIAGDLSAALSKARGARALEDIRQRLSIATAAGELGVFDWDAELDHATWDERMYEIFALPADGKGWSFPQLLELIEPDERERIRRDVAKTLEQGELHVLTRFVRVDRQRRWLEIHGRALPAVSGRGPRIVGIARDVTEQKNREERLLASESQYKSLVNASPDGILINRERRVTFANHAFVRMIGAQDYTELLGRDPFDFLHPDFHDEVRLRIDHLLATGETNPPFEQRFIRLDGEPLEVEVISTPYDTAEGRAVQLLIRDITLRKQAALAQTRLAAIVESTEDAIVGKDLRGIIHSWNDAAARIFGYPAEEVIGRSIMLIVPPDLAREEADILARIARGERLVNHETVRVRKGGERFPVSLTISPIRDDHARVIGASKIARDITDRRRIERELQQLLEREQAARSQAEEASRLKDDFLATVSHELRAPMSAISGWTHVLGTAALSNQDRARAIEAIQRGVKSQDQLISDLLDVSRVVAGKMRLDVRPLQLVETIEQSIETVRPAADAKRVRLQVLLDPNTGPLSGDPDRLQQVVWNLLSNAIKFTPAGGRIEIRAERIDSHAVISVSDTGVGIAPEILPFVFDRFRQADSAPNRRFGGLGLGLAIVRHLVELHGGTVSADSPGPGQGATFVIRLPVTVSSRSRTSDREHRGAALGITGQGPRLDSLRLLVVDDEPGTREVMLELLRRAGAEVRVAASADEALEMLDQWRPDVLISDIGMPGMDGYALIRAIRSRSAARGGRVPAAALTAYSRTEDRLRALSAGFQMHLPKPVEPVELVTVIASLAQRF